MPLTSDHTGMCFKKSNLEQTPNWKEIFLTLPLWSIIGGLSSKREGGTGRKARMADLKQ